MTQLDYTKETIAYLKFWLGVLVFSDISIIGWLLANVGAAATFKTVGAILVAAAISVAVLLMHRKIGNYSVGLKWCR